ncbi:unnamed protein product [Zymoseptoria tritici ST99CH_3D1]|nr:unnamed protein product [Zymoseptoria tritici ST99CH_3D1]
MPLLKALLTYTTCHHAADLTFTMKLIVFTITALLPGLSLVSGAKTWAKDKKGMCCKSTLDFCHKLGYWGCAVSDRSYCVRETSGLKGPTAWCNESCLESENSEGVDARDAKDYITDGGLCVCTNFDAGSSYDTDSPCGPP